MQFLPHPMLASGHAQTLAGHLARPPSISWQRNEYQLQLSDGDSVVAVIDAPALSQFQTGKAMITMFHGISGNHDTNYMLHIAAKLIAAGYYVARISHRGVGNSYAKGIYHAGSAHDVAEVLHMLERRFPNLPIFAIGFSLSGSMLLNLLSKYPDRISPQLKGAIAVCPPVDLKSCAIALTKNNNFLFHKYFVKQLAKNAKQRFQVSLPRKLSLIDFDNCFTAPRAGYRDSNEYYEQCSTKDVLARIHKPLLLLSAADDPIIPAHTWQNITLHANTTWIHSPGGGHMGFIAKQRTAFGDRRWMDACLVQWIQAQV